MLMPVYADFCTDEAAVGMTRVEAVDAAAAEALVMEEHPGGRVHAVDLYWSTRRLGCGYLRIGCGRGQPRHNSGIALKKGG